MPAKRFNYKQFLVRFSDGTDELIYCSSARSGDHTSQRALIIGWKDSTRNIAGYAQYWNRPWEAYDYENAVHALADKLPAPYGDELRAWSEKHARGEAEEAEKFVSDFKKEYAKASPGMKAALAAGPMIENAEQAKATLAVLKMGNIIRELKNN
jgi:hypothetical protein